MSRDADAIAQKTIAASEIDPTRSNKHSFHGVVPFRKLLGQRRITFHARFVYVHPEQPIFSESFVTWYDDCEFNPNPRCRNHWRLYYPDTLAISHARQGDQLLIARIEDDELLLVILPASGVQTQHLSERYANDRRLDTLPPPEPSTPLLASLPQSFTQAKKILSREIYAHQDHRQTFYCGCNYSKTGAIDPTSCGYAPRRTGSIRSSRLEWEHIVPASYIGKGRTCWERGNPDCVSSHGKPFKGRRCCNKVDAQFRAVTADLNNLVPEIGELNADRSNFPHRELAGEPRTYGACDFEVDFTYKRAEPAVPLRGFIARTWLYMHKAHDVLLSDEDFTVYRHWDATYAPAQWEIKRQRRIRNAANKSASDKTL